MRQVRRMLRMRREGSGVRAIGKALGVARSTVQDTLTRADAAGLEWPLPDEVTDEVLEARLFANSAGAIGARRRPEPDWAHQIRELKRPAVTLVILWEDIGRSGLKVTATRGSASFYATSSKDCRR